MNAPKKKHPAIKTSLHPRNKHRSRYDLQQLSATCPALAPFVELNKYQDQSIDFANPAAVKMLNKALLQQHYGIDYWDIPQDYLCPPIPGRADYIHHVADLFADKAGNIPQKISCLDIGVGANCVYPIIGHQEYGWSFIGSDIDPVAIKSAAKIVAENAVLQGNIDLRLQENPKQIFKGILNKNERIDLSICNPPFHASAQEAQAGTRRKLRNLKKKKPSKTTLNFGGKNNELWCEGGERRFIRDMIHESKAYANSCRWFTTLISKEVNLAPAYRELKKVNAVITKTIPMGQGNKVSRILAWRF